MSNFNTITFGRRPAFIQERCIVTIHSPTFATMSEPRMQRWLMGNGLLRTHYHMWVLNAGFHGLEIYFRHPDTAERFRTRGFRVGANRNHPLCPTGPKTDVFIKKRTGILDSQDLDVILDLVRGYGYPLHHVHSGNDVTVKIILNRNIPRDMLRNYIVSYSGQPLQCFLCRGSHKAEVCPMKCGCGQGRTHHQNSCRESIPDLIDQDELFAESEDESLPIQMGTLEVSPPDVPHLPTQDAVLPAYEDFRADSPAVPAQLTNRSIPFQITSETQSSESM